MDLYNFIKQLFHRKLLAFGINPDDPFGAPVATDTLKAVLKLIFRRIDLEFVKNS